MAFTYCFWCRSRRRRHRHRRRCSRCFLSALCILNQCVDFDLTCTDTLLGQRKKVVGFWWPWSHFESHTSTLNYRFEQKRLSALYILNQMKDSGQTSHIVTLQWCKDLLILWWPWPNYQVTTLNRLQKWILSAHYLLTNQWILTRPAQKYQ